VNDTLLPGLQPYIDSTGNLVVPVRPVAEALGATVAADDYNGAAHITLSKGERRLDLFCGSGMAFMDGLPDEPETVPALKDGRAIAALRTLLRWSGAECVWDAQSRTAYVSTDGRQHTPAAASAAAGAKPGLILQTAETYRGAPYVWGGTKPAGFDCSGFVQFVYRRHGVELPRTSREMFAVGNAVQELKPGDLVFFCTVGNTTSHVGIYIGDNRFISATTSYGVHVASLHSTYWGPKFIGAKRVL
jgi:peptidoglycan endopeptidase LytE